MVEKLTWVHCTRKLTTCLTLHCHFLTMKKKANQPISQWIAKVCNLAQHLRDVSVTVDDEDIILALTMGLLHLYNLFIVTLDATPSD